MTLNHYLFADKPSGVSSHSPGPNDVYQASQEGYVEFLSRRLDQPLWLCHRLDKRTSGVLMIAKSAEAAEQARLWFANRQLQKTYYFITDSSTTQTEFEVHSHIVREGSRYISHPIAASKSVAPATPDYARTHFQHIQASGDFSLWQAQPQTGRTHQIRLHAQSIGLPILGDTTYGGSPFATLMLHNEGLKLATSELAFDHRSPLPYVMQNLELCSNPTLASWLLAWERRERWLRTLEQQMPTLRWIHTEGGSLRVDQLGETVSATWIHEKPPSKTDLENIQKLFVIKNVHSWRLRHQPDRGRSHGPTIEWTSQPVPPARWKALENGMTFEFRFDSGQSTGLFLDQRANREWLRHNCAGKNVLNLFCYTAGFSVAAALGRASKIVSVDAMSSVLDWAQQNFRANDLDPSAYEFRKMDVRAYLQYAVRKGLQFDFIICDPPSFGRSDKGVFRIEKDLPTLVETALRVLAPGGRLLLSTNYEAWTYEALRKKVETWVRNAKRPVQIESTPLADWDFEFPREEPVMKSLLLS